MVVAMRCTTKGQRGFTLIEILAATLILVVGLITVVGMVLYGLGLAQQARGRSLGISAALTAIVDPASIRGGTSTATVQDGYVNGLWVHREETELISLAPNGASFGTSSSLSDSGGNPLLGSIPRSIQFVTVRVEVYSAQNGRPIVSMLRRIAKESL
jgi:prepilin-type N-terminal cleavage/methylation domain-containing protein